MQLRQSLIAMTCAIVVAGCATSQVNQNERQVDSLAERADGLLEAKRAEVTGPAPVLSVIKDRDYAAPRPRRVKEQERRLPIECTITYTPSGSATLVEFTQRVTKDCGVRVRITPDALAHVNGGGVGAQAVAAPVSSPMDLPPSVDLPEPVAGGGRYASAPAGGRIDVRYQAGPLEGLLDAVTARLGLGWKYSNGGISIHYLDTQVFRLYNLAAATTMESRVNSGVQSNVGVSGGSSGQNQGGVSGEAGSSQSTSVTINTQPLEDLTNLLTAMLTPGVGRLSVTETNGGMVVVTDTPEVLGEVEAVIANINEMAKKQVVFHVEVLQVRSDRTHEFGINWDLAYQSISDSFGLGLVNALTGSDDAVQGIANIVSGNSRFSGSQLIMTALDQQGDVAVIRRAPITALNYEAVPVQLADQVGYIASIQQSATADVGLSTAIQPGTVTVGFNMHLLPKVQPDGETILLRYSLNQSELNGIRRVDSGDSSVEVPDISSTIFSQNVRIQSGQTLVVSGFDNQKWGVDRSGVGSPKWWLFGGGSQTEASRDSIVVLITPYVMSEDA